MRHTLISFMGLWLVAACAGDKTDTDTDTSADTDTDTDSDTDSDTDVDADTDSDADADTAATGDTSPTGDTGDPFACADADLGSLVPQVYKGTNVGSSDDDGASCGGKGDGDVALAFEAPADGEYAFVLNAEAPAFSALLYARDVCGGTELDCVDDVGQGTEILRRTMVTGERMLLVVERSPAGAFTLDVVSVAATETDCRNLVDDDLDGDLDCADADCAKDKMCSEICNDGIDDNKNGLTDCEDPACALDISCNETCDNGIDDSLDGTVDCDDPLCAKDPLCLPQCPDVFATGTVPETLTGDTIGDIDEGAPSCSSSNGAGDVFVEFTAPFAGDFVFDTVGSDFDAALAVLDACGGTELGCSDDAFGMDAHVGLTLTAKQTVVVLVDGALNNEGNYTLNVAQAQLNETDCADGRDLDDDGDVDCADSDCFADSACVETCDNNIDDNGNGLIDCFDVEYCGADPACLEDCSNGLDDNGDGLFDCDDPDCADNKVCVENCDNDVDDNGDGLIDCQDPVQCGKDAACAARCPDRFAAGTLPETIESNTFGRFDEMSPSCDFFNVAPDVQIEYTAPSAGDYVFDTIGSAYDTVLLVQDGCGGLELGCSVDHIGDQSQVVVNLAAKQTVIVTVDGQFIGTGEYVLNVAELEKVEDCAAQRDLDDDGVIACLDSDCVGDAVCDEICDNGIDDNGTGLIDCRDTTHCSTDPACADDCPDVTAAGTLPEEVQGFTRGAHNEIDPTCDIGNSAGDRQIEYTAPSAGDYVFDTVGSDFDTVLSISDTCGGTELDCSDNWLGTDAQIVHTMKQNDVVIINVDGKQDAEGDYVLNVAELEASESVCDDGRDLDNDGLADCDDSDCETDDFCIENICDDLLDEEGDGLVDCHDPDCAGEKHCVAVCPNTDITTSPDDIAFSTLGLPDDNAPSCRKNSNASDYTVEFTAPATDLYTFDTYGSSFDTVLYALDGCGGTELACNDDSNSTPQSEISLNLTAGDSVIIVVDGYNGASGAAVLNVQ